MSKILHQAGHQTCWTLESYNENIGDGIIFSPVHYSVDNIKKNIDNKTKEHSFFDPQFYIPNSQKTKLNTYDFFPEKIMKGFSTKDYSLVAHEVAEKCIDFQLDNNFHSLLIPARYFNEMITDYIDRQKYFTVEPFLSILDKKNIKKNIYLTLPLTSGMISDIEYRTNILNWITSYPEIKGVYLLVNFDITTKQIKDYNKLNNYVTFINDLKLADLEIISGYCNTEGLILTLLDCDFITIGAYENTRQFSVDKFLINDEDKRGPATRFYFPKLLNWIRYSTIMEIKEDHKELWDKIYIPTEYSEDVFNKNIEPHFTQSPSYKHHFKLIYEQYKLLNSLDIVSRKQEISKWINTASDLYNEITNKRIMFFDDNCKGEHLPVWNRLINSLNK